MSQLNNGSLIIETAKVVEVDDGYATVECVSKSACGSCGSAEHCGNSAIAKAFPTRTHQLKVKLTDSVEVGDQIELGLVAKNMLQSALLVYLLPLIMLIAGAGIGKWLSQQIMAGDWLIALSAFSGLLLGFLSVRLLARYFIHHSRYRPRMLSRQS
ncbi:SoxR reducing system RseC family protein [Agarivorans sp. DSG3-1]|uniref:SoxR reducing system RseC family protein n=1 Tax=Agarivorans sp. DSG3-1 TaxID=3342249 RepID=UPI00398F73EC